MKKLTCAAVLALASVSWFAGRSIVKGADPTPPVAADAGAPAKLTDISIDETAGKLVVWAQANHDPIGLAMAARVLASAPPAPMENPQKEKSPVPADAPPADTTPLTPHDLLTEAKGMTTDPDALSAIAQIEKSMPALARQAIDGPRDDHDVIPPEGKTVYDIAFAGGQPMELSVCGNQSNAVDFHVFDEEGHEMQSDICDHFLATPPKTEHFKIVIRNTSKNYLSYWFMTN
jgi:hypothetical protein